MILLLLLLKSVQLTFLKGGRGEKVETEKKLKIHT